MLRKMSPLIKEDRNLYMRIRKRQEKGTMREYVVDGNLYYDDCELEAYKPRKRGRPPVIKNYTIVTKNND